MDLLCPLLPFKILLWSDSLAFNEIAPQSRVSVCLGREKKNHTEDHFPIKSVICFWFFFPFSLISCFHPSQTQAHLSALFTRNTGGYWGERSFTQVWSHRHISLYWSSHAGKAFLRANFYLSLCFLPFQMSNPVGFTQTKELQEDPFHQEHEATRYAQWKVWRQTRPSLLVGTSPRCIMAGCPSQWTAQWMFLTLQAPS